MSPARAVNAARRPNRRNTQSPPDRLHPRRACASLRTLILPLLVPLLLLRAAAPAAADISDGSELLPPRSPPPAPPSPPSPPSWPPVPPGFLPAAWPPPPSNDPRPELDPLIETIVCPKKIPNRCFAVTADNLTSVCTRRRTVIFSDRRACFAAAKERAGYRPEDLGARTGGETVFCRNLLGILSRLGYSYIIAKRVEPMEECLRVGEAAGVNHLFFVHDNWAAIASDELLVKGRKVRQPFREECLFTMSYWGTKLPSHVWPGDLRYYLCVWPNGHNTHIYLEKPAQCPVYRGFQQVPLPTYGVLFGKYKVMPWKIERTETFAHDPGFWEELRSRVHMVVLDCSDELAAKFGWGPDYREHYTCWRDSPLAQQIGYHNLMMGASFYLGLGDTLHSPTPVEVLYCRTPIIMPPYQHNLANMSVIGREFFPVSSGDDVLRAVDVVLSDCRVGFNPVAEPPPPPPPPAGVPFTQHSLAQAAGRGATQAVRKINSCFREPPSLDVVMAEEVIADRVQKLIHARQILCSNRPRHVPMNDTLVNGTLLTSSGAAVESVVNGVVVYGAMINGTLVMANGTIFQSTAVFNGTIRMTNGTVFNGPVLKITSPNGTMYGMLINTTVAPVRIPQASNPPAAPPLAPGEVAAPADSVQGSAQAAEGSGGAQTVLQVASQAASEEDEGQAVARSGTETAAQGLGQNAGQDSGS